MIQFDLLLIKQTKGVRPFNYLCIIFIIMLYWIIFLKKKLKGICYITFCSHPLHPSKWFPRDFHMQILHFSSFCHENQTIPFLFLNPFFSENQENPRRTAILLFFGRLRFFLQMKTGNRRDPRQSGMVGDKLGK